MVDLNSDFYIDCDDKSNAKIKPKKNEQDSGDLESPENIEPVLRFDQHS